MSSTGRGGRYERLGRYYTPDNLACAIAEKLPIAPGERILEPSVGGGAWVHAVEILRWERSVDYHLEVMDIDIDAPGLMRRGLQIRRQGDILKTDPVLAPDWIVGNPPYALDVRIVTALYPEIWVSPTRTRPVPMAERHVRRALQIAAIRGGNVVFLLRDGFLGSKEREAFFKEHPPRHIWTVTPRPSFGGGNDSCEYCAIWWDTAWQGPTTWSRLPWVL